jgi:hypothetical protein
LNGIRGYLSKGVIYPDNADFRAPMTENIQLTDSRGLDKAAAAFISWGQDE